MAKFCDYAPNRLGHSDIRILPSQMQRLHLAIHEKKQSNLISARLYIDTRQTC